jgi:DNA (cytosine-5)-methyltransferase 1
MPTVVSTANGATLVSAFLAKHFGGVVGVPIDTPLPTTTTRGTQNQVVAANLVHLNHGEKQWNGVDEPLRTQTTANHAALVYTFLTKYFGNGIGSSLHAPMPTSTSRDHFGLVTVRVQGEPYVIVDIGMRMLKPRELARAQGFPDSYILTGSNTNQVERIGNSVCPHVAAAVVRANCLSEVPA